MLGSGWRIWVTVSECGACFSLCRHLHCEFPVQLCCSFHLQHPCDLLKNAWWVFFCLPGATVNAKDHVWLTPLHRAAASRNEVSNALVSVCHFKQSNYLSVRWLHPLILLCIIELHQNIALMQEMQHTADICLKLSLLLPSPQRAVGLLLRRGAEANARDKFWQTPLHVATANRATRCAEALLTQLSNLNMADRTGRTALHHAAQSGFQEVRLQLFPSPMAVSHRTQNRATPGFCL